jgi:poly(A) polymerase
MEIEKLSVNPGAFRILDKVNKLLAAENIPAFIVGGFVRDLLIQRSSVDIDIAVRADARVTARKIAGALGGKYISLDEANGVARVVIPGEPFHLDLASFPGDIEDDLFRRDFTINAMALPLDGTFGATVAAARLIDPYSGLSDLRRRILKIVNPGAFACDAVRLLRAVRIAAELGLCIERLTETRLRQCSGLISGVAGERVREELLRLLALPGAGQRLSYLDNLGILTAIIPELEQARGVSQPALHVWDVLTHSLKMVSAVEFLLRDGEWDHAAPDTLAKVPWSDSLAGHFEEEIGHGATRKTLLKLAALLHDIAKPEMKTTDVTGRTRFLGHPQAGAATASAILTRLRFSNKEIDYTGLLVKYHLRPTQMSNEGAPTRRAVYRFFRDTGEAGIDLLFLSLADHLAARGATLDAAQWREHAQMTAAVLAAREEQASAPQKARLIDGNEIMTSFRLKPGPRLGEILEAVQEAAAAGEINGKAQALTYVKRLLARQNTPRNKSR